MGVPDGGAIKASRCSPSRAGIGTSPAEGWLPLSSWQPRHSQSYRGEKRYLPAGRPSPPRPRGACDLLIRLDPAASSGAIHHGLLACSGHVDLAHLAVLRHAGTALRLEVDANEPFSLFK